MENGIKSVVIQEIIDIAEKNGISKVVLFGSRARGDYQRASDIDLAVEGTNVIGFTLDVKDKTSTLLDFDVINLQDDLQDTFRQEIIREGVVLYEKI